MLLLSETKVAENHVSSTLNCLGFFLFVHAPPIGCKVGLSSAWRSGLDVEVVLYHQHLNSLIIYSDPPNQPWLLSLVYGPARWG
jgi:hypothetical protein